MTKFILHGGYTRKDNELNRSFFRELVKDIPDEGTLLMVLFASRDDDPTEAFEELKQKIGKTALPKVLNIVLASEDSFIEELKAADGVYFHGGSTNKLLKKLLAFSSLKSFVEGKTIAGSSAGAYAIAKLGTSHSEDESPLREGLGLAPLRVICHYESAELPPKPQAVEIIKRISPELELVLLHDCEWKVFNS